MILLVDFFDYRVLFKGTMRRDHGWIHTLLSEAENERMHLLTFLELRKPGWIFRAFVLLGQGVFFK
jgi:threonyl-tRNA synthetase